MAQYLVYVEGERTISEADEYEIEAASEDEAMDQAEEMFVNDYESDFITTLDATEIEDAD